MKMVEGFDEHAQLIAFIEKKDCESAVRLWKDRHWSFSVHEQYIRQFYSNTSKKLNPNWRQKKNTKPGKTRYPVCNKIIPIISFS